VSMVIRAGHNLIPRTTGQGSVDTNITPMGTVPVCRAHSAWDREARTRTGHSSGDFGVVAPVAIQMSF